MKEIFETIFIILFMIIVICLITFTIYSAVSYWNLKEVLNDCNKNLGKGNWTFIEDSEKYTCKSYNSQSYITQTIISSTSKTCFENGIEVKC